MISDEMGRLVLLSIFSTFIILGLAGLVVGMVMAMMAVFRGGYRLFLSVSLGGRGGPGPVMPAPVPARGRGGAGLDLGASGPRPARRAPLAHGTRRPPGVAKERGGERHE